MNENLLFDESPLLIIPTLAKLIGLNESIILQQIHYWLKRTNNVRLDRKWVYFTYDELTMQFPFFSKSTVRRLISKLENEGLLSSNHFNKFKVDNTKWYTINYKNLENLKLKEKECETSDLTLNVKEMPLSSENEQTMCPKGTVEILDMDRPLVQNEQTSCSTWADDVLDLNRPLPESTTEITSKNTSETSSSSKITCEKKGKEDPFRFYEQNGFGVIGSFIADKLKAWCIDLSDDLVIEAMKLAVENGAKRWNYIEAILRDWVDKGYQTVEDVHAARLVFRDQMKHQSTKKPIRHEILPEWFHNREQSETEHNPGFEEDKLKENRELAPSHPQEPASNTSFEEKKRQFEEMLTRMREKDNFSQ
ncbi:DnaD domain-containing protein [Bacillus timonensis]|uniref:DnaD domain-containing protein n=1 Tax=Bacillus timonensis TaxID=1033734 RepID=UPI000288DC8A|nr:DnaD domain protein [Bacillus timonensis]